MKNRSTEKERTLKIRRPFGQTILLAAILLIILLVLVETAARTDFVRDALPAPSIASGHKRLDIKLPLLDDLVREEGRIDCIFLGGSDVNASINPDVFSRAYEKKTGEKLICFNFGLDGFIPPAAAVMAKILVEKYHPRLLVWGFSPTSFSDEFKRTTKEIVSRNSWCRYRLGDFNLEGWLTDYSRAYRYFLRFRTWLERPGYFEKLSIRGEKTSKYGYHTAERVNTFTRFKRDEEQESRYRNILSDFNMDNQALAALEKTLRLHSQTGIVLVDIPVHPRYLTLHERGADVYRKSASYIKKRAGQYGVLFISTNRFDLIPRSGFRNISHMNTRGARIFSRWLGRQIGRAVSKGFLALPPRPGTVVSLAGVLK